MISKQSTRLASALLLILTTGGCAQISGLLKPSVTTEVVGASSVCEMSIVKMTDAEHEALKLTNEDADKAIRANNGAIQECRAREELR